MHPLVVRSTFLLSGVATAVALLGSLPAQAEMAPSSTQRHQLASISTSAAQLQVRAPFTPQGRSMQKTPGSLVATTDERLPLRNATTAHQNRLERSASAINLSMEGRTSRRSSFFSDGPLVFTGKGAGLRAKF